MTAEDQCTQCTAGSYCLTTGLTTPTGDCTEGYYCPEGAGIATVMACPVHHYCPTGQGAPLPCGSGTFMDHTNAVECDLCPVNWLVMWNLSTIIYFYLIFKSVYS